MGYQILLFDLDDTLLDFGANEAQSLRTLFQHYGYDLTDGLFDVYNSVNKRLWSDYENGQVALPVVLNTRFSETMKKLGQTVDGVQWERMYRQLLSEGAQLIDGALEVCERLAQNHRLFIVTNGVTSTQLSRLKLSGLSDYFEEVYTSECIGHQKPSPEFFEYVKGHIPGFHTKQTLMIGDLLSADIKGGNRAGLDTCWLNRKGQKPVPEIQSTYTITQLTELYEICGA